MNNEYLQFDNLEFSIAIGIMNDFLGPNYTVPK